MKRITAITLFAVLILPSFYSHSQLLQNSRVSTFEFKPLMTYDPFQPLPESKAKPEDTLRLPRYNDLTGDVPEYNKRYPLIIPVLEVPLTNGLIWAYDRYVLNAPYSYISLQTVENNFKNGWEWDTDDFQTNFSLHPYAGSVYYNVARSNGYNFYQSLPFVLGGSLMWEYTMENTQPSYNDLINTTVSGIFLGEVLYRISSSFLNDTKRGASRTFLEITGAVIDPARGFNRLWQGKTFRTTPYDVYQKEPLYLTLSGGARQTNDGTDLGSGPIAASLNLNFSYGDPYEIKNRKPYDYFRLRTDLYFGNSNNIVTNVIGDGYLFGTNTDSSNNMQMLIGGFQHYDYWNTDSFEIGTIGFGAGIISKLPLSTESSFQNTFHLSAVPLAGNNSRKIVTDDINEGYKDYSYSGGAEFKLESSLNFSWGQIAAEYYFYWLHTYVGTRGDNLINILRPRIHFKIFKFLNIGGEYLLYNRNDYRADGSSLHITTGEQRVFLLLNFENF